MKILDKQGRLFGKISVLDLFVALVVLILLYAAYTKFNIIDTTAITTKTTPVEYTLVIRNIRDTNAGLLRVGDEVYTDIGADIGRVTNVDIREATTLTQLTDGTYVEGKIESKVDVFLTISAGCAVSNGRYYIDRTFELGANREDRFVTKWQKFVATVDTFTLEPGNG